MNNGGNFNLKIYKDSENKISIEFNSIGFTSDELVNLLTQQIQKIKDNKYLSAQRCIVCGEVIPEGRQICPICENL